MATIFFLYGGGQISSFSPVVTFCKEKCLTGKIYFPNWKVPKSQFVVFWRLTGIRIRCEPGKSFLSFVNDL